jgi:hypothetical protein
MQLAALALPVLKAVGAEDLDRLDAGSTYSRSPGSFVGAIRCRA